MLTFAIPTWNRGEKLRSCVHRISAQILASGEHVDIHISDNGSNDDTPQVIRELSSTYSFVSSARKDSNVGFDRNLFSVMAGAKGEYIWIFSDDDFLADGALEAILTVIRTAKPSYIATNYYSCDDQANACTDQPYEPYMVSEDVAGANIERIFRASGWVLGFISRNIYLRKLMQIESYESHLPSIEVWSQIFVIAQVVSQRNDAYLSSYYSVGCRISEARYGSSAMLRDLPNVLDYSLKTFKVSEATRQFCLGQVRDHFMTWRSYIKYRALGPEVSPLIYPPSHRFIPSIPRFLVRAALRVKKLLD